VTSAVRGTVKVLNGHAARTNRHSLGGSACRFSITCVPQHVLAKLSLEFVRSTLKLRNTRCLHAKPAKWATLSPKSPGIGRISVKDAYFWNAPC